jgi:hypothetical protein
MRAMLKSMPVIGKFYALPMCLRCFLPAQEGKNHNQMVVPETGQIGIEGFQSTCAHAGHAHPFPYV